MKARYVDNNSDSNFDVEVIGSAPLMPGMVYVRRCHDQQLLIVEETKLKVIVEAIVIPIKRKEPDATVDSK